MTDDCMGEPMTAQHPGHIRSTTTTTTAAFAMTPAEIDQYHHDGFLVRRNVFDADEIADIADSCDVLVDLVTGSRTNTGRAFGSYVFDFDPERAVIIKWEGDSDVVHGLEPFAHLSPRLEAWALDERLLDPARQALGAADIELYTEKLNLKRPHHGGANPLHQDYPYWIKTADNAAEIVTTMIFLDDSTIENGCLWVAPGSHTRGEWTARRTDGDDFAGNELAGDVYADAEMSPVEVPAGSTVTFGPFLVHSSEPNRSDQGRRALLYSYQPAGRRRQVDNLTARASSG